MTDLRVWLSGRSSRGCYFDYCEGEHVSLTDLKNDFRRHSYLRKRNICPNAENFSVSEVSHVTEKSGLEGIFEDEGFRGSDSFLWWSLSMHDGDLPKGASSPAFQEESRYGNFRITFPLRQILNQYSKQCCYSTAPVLRILNTQVYKQEILYSVLVHPQYMTHYRKYPRLPFDDESLCGYRKGIMSWCCQSPSDRYYLYKPIQYFVWDHVALAFHMKADQVLYVDRDCLSDSLSVCKVASKELLREPKMSLQEAKETAYYYKNV